MIAGDGDGVLYAIGDEGCARRQPSTLQSITNLFPDSKRSKQSDPSLYSAMKKLQDAQNDPEVSVE